MDVIANSCGAKLLYGLVEFETQAPCEAQVNLAEYAILGFQKDADRLVPVTMAGLWRGGELRTSVSGAYIWGVTAGDGVELPDGKRCRSRTEFELYAIAVVGAQVRKVRKEKGWPEDRMPKINDEASQRDTAKRMYAEALSRLNDSDLLAESPRTQSDSASLLRILAFEVLLKCALRLSGVEPYKTHNYLALWEMLPAEAQEAILRNANARMPGHADLSELPRILRAYRHVFEKARYYYELQEGRTAEEVHKKGLAWEARGAPLKEADVCYYPAELDCLIAGLRARIEAQGLAN